MNNEPIKKQLIRTCRHVASGVKHLTVYFDGFIEYEVELIDGVTDYTEELVEEPSFKTHAFHKNLSTFLVGFNVENQAFVDMMLARRITSVTMIDEDDATITVTDSPWSIGKLRISTGREAGDHKGYEIILTTIAGKSSIQQMDHTNEK